MFTARCLAAFAQAAIGSQLLPAGEPVEPMDCIEQHEAEDLAHAGDGLHEREGMGIVLLGGLDDGKLQSTEQLGIIRPQGQIDRDGLWPGGISKALSNAIAGGLVGDLLADVGPVVLAVRMLDRGQEVGAFAHAVRPAPEQVPGRPPLRGIDIRLGQQAATKQRGHRLGIALIVCGLAPVDGFHVEGMPPHKGHPLLCTQVGQPVPGEDPFDCHPQPGTIGRHGLEKRFRSGFHGAVHQDVSVMVHDTAIHAPGRQVDTAVKLVQLGVESPEVSAS